MISRYQMIKGFLFPSPNALLESLVRFRRRGSSALTVLCSDWSDTCSQRASFAPSFERVGRLLPDLSILFHTAFILFKLVARHPL